MHQKLHQDIQPKTPWYCDRSIDSCSTSSLWRHVVTSSPECCLPFLPFGRRFQQQASQLQNGFFHPWIPWSQNAWKSNQAVCRFHGATCVVIFRVTSPWNPNPEFRGLLKASFFDSSCSEIRGYPTLRNLQSSHLLMVFASVWCRNSDFEILHRQSCHAHQAVGVRKFAVCRQLPLASPWRTWLATNKNLLFQKHAPISGNCTKTFASSLLFWLRRS